ncbi:MAG: sigma 54-interacting transcriptional regulator [Bryobacter sp.]|jgi:transcriptional regulator with PAS, ATPase and Fis domain|nr:sigma 54-interacting transcriptional regulator [Bryobacter sp.]
MTPRVIEHFGKSALVAGPVLNGVLERVRRVAASNATIMIRGESGTGKELVARIAHESSMRASRPFVEVNCGALPEHLVESELFGYERGAFSGAWQQKPGLFEVAHQGSIFLDEVGELDARLQVKLLRVLDGAGFYRLGGVRKVEVDVRVIAATNLPLEKVVAEGRFRRDLYHRLEQVRLTVPPLRERREEILPLARFFLEEAAPGCEVSAEAAAVLEQYDWPGNVRELRNTIVRAALMAVGHRVMAGDLELEVQPAEPAPHDLESAERRLIEEALTRNAGHQQRAAAELGISRRTLCRRLREYRLEGVYGF